MFSQKEKEQLGNQKQAFHNDIQREKIKQVFLLQFHDELFKFSKLEGVH
jgi:hypothetical protein